jgi:hypothetical protein
MEEEARTTTADCLGLSRIRVDAQKVGMGKCGRDPPGRRKAAKSVS